MNITKITEEYISSHPSIKDALKKGLVNYSALAREICDFHRIGNFDAALIACRRYSGKIRECRAHEEDIIDMVRTAKIRVRNKISVVIIEKPREMEPVYAIQKSIKKGKGDFNLIEGENAITIITNSDYISGIKERFRSRIVKITGSLVQITLLFDERIETTPGVVSYIYSLLAENGINIMEEMSCWTDIMMVIDENDMARTMKALEI